MQRRSVFVIAAIENAATDWFRGHGLDAALLAS